MEPPISEPQGFKILIAGGSLVGLGLALALEHAGIDYELFEKREFAPELGASIGLFPHTVKILEQLGAWADIEKETIPLMTRDHFDGNGHCMEESLVLMYIRELLSRPVVFLERSRLLQILYNHVRDKSKLRSHTAVVAYEETSQGVIVTTDDGSKHHGHLLIGADGVHSTVRGLMADQIAQVNPVLAKEITEAFSSEYNCIFAVSRNTPERKFLPDASVHHVYYHRYSAVSVAGVQGIVFWFLFTKASEITRTPNCPRFSAADADACIERYGSSSIGPGYNIQELWDARIKGGMIPLEEGIVKQWSHGRVVLLGDSAHKTTINAGLGANLAYEGIARLTNGLVPLLKETPIPSTEQLNEVFKNYASGQNPRAELVHSLSGGITRYESQNTWFLKFAAKYIIPLISDRVKAKLFAAFARGGPSLEYLPLPLVQEKTDIDSPVHYGRRISTPLVIGGVIVASVAAWVWRAY